MPGYPVCCAACRWEMPSNAMPKHWRARHEDPRLSLSVPFDEQAEMVRLYECGLSCPMIAEQGLFWSPEMIRRVLHTWGYQQLRRSGRRPFLPIEDALECAHYYALGWSQRKIADTLGLHRTVVRRRLERAGVEFRPRPRRKRRYRRSQAREAA